MEGMSWQLTLAAIAFVCGVHEVVATQAPDTLPNDLAFILPLVIILVVVILILILIVCVVYRARYGYFCCWKPRMSYRVQEPNRGTDEGADRDPNSSLPEYESNSPEPGIPPPDYRDALQDVIISSGPTATVSTELAEPAPNEDSTTSDSEPHLPHSLVREEGREQRENEEEERREGGEAAVVVEQQGKEDTGDDDSLGACDERTPLNP